MIITCESCSTRFVLDDALIKPGGSRVRCSKCRHVFTAFPATPPETPAAVAPPDPPDPGETDIPFDEPNIQNQPDSDPLYDNDFIIDSPDPDPEDTDTDISEIEDLARDFDQDGLALETTDFGMDEPELDIRDFELETGPSSGAAALSSDSDTADIEIRFTPDEDAGPDLELETLTLDLDGLAPETPPMTDADSLSSHAPEPESDDNGGSGEADGESEQTASAQEKFAEYDKVLDQETEPGDTGTTTPDPDGENNPSLPDPPLPLADDEIEPPGAAGPKPLVTPLSAQSVRQKRGTKKKKKVSLPVIILLVLFLLILAAHVAIVRLGVTIPVVSDIQIPFITEWLQPKQPPAPRLKPIPDEPSIDGRFVSNKSAGELFIVTGRVKNPSDTAVSYIQVKGTLMTKDKTKTKTLTAYCGNIIAEETLKSGNISDITRQMGVRQGNRHTNVNIKPGTSVMFMLVFSNLPEGLTNFTVAVQGFEPVRASKKK